MKSDWRNLPYAPFTGRKKNTAALRGYSEKGKERINLKWDKNSSDKEKQSEISVKKSVFPVGHPQLDGTVPLQTALSRHISVDQTFRPHARRTFLQKADTISASYDFDLHR